MSAYIKKSIGALGVCLALSPLATASILGADNAAEIDAQAVPVIGAGNGDFGVFNRAPLVPEGDFTGVVSIEIATPDGFGLCTGSAISKRHIITAAHCVEDNSDTGRKINISEDGFGVRTVFTDGGNLVSDFDSSVLTVSGIDIHPDYSGFGLCDVGEASGFSGGCLNDDIAILTLAEEIPDGVEIYDFYTGPQLQEGTMLTMVGHGTTGDGFNGFEANSSSFFDKRFGFNIMELFDCNDGFSGNVNGRSGGFSDADICQNAFGQDTEVWYADFDGYDAFLDLIDGAGDGFIDTFCQFGICDRGFGDVLATEVDPINGLFEAVIGGGDSGGPSFVYDANADRFLLAGNNTFGLPGTGPFGIPGAFGDIFGGNLYAPYISWVNDNFLATPAPAGIALVLGSGLWMGFRRRR
ncbi:trypsin-like serine protease [Glaciecola petra]|uniref:Trypsin-like serine protease n=1 Tax=Glaciecola petra TaxID=3075602 RepID=A0ABU2ZUI1_9ALTE|nr:trypsin-like serine protease [Aestuariibacter sp. P117]MDT0595974.1 trypsin-like serine protease [Aestuariibacter sp. P117]